MITSRSTSAVLRRGVFQAGGVFTGFGSHAAGTHRRADERRESGSATKTRDALNTPLQQSGLTTTVQAAPFRQTQRDASVALAIEFGSDALPFAPRDGGLMTNSVELSFFGINQDGKAQRSTHSQFNLRLRPESFTRVKTGVLRLNPRLTLEPGRYQIRVGARETVGSRVGTVFYDLHVPDFHKEPLMLSGLLVTSASANAAMNAMADPAAHQLLQGPAVSRRTFARADTLTIFAEIYDNSSSRQPRQIDTAVSLLSESGQDVFSARDTVLNPGDAAHWTAFGWRATSP